MSSGFKILVHEISEDFPLSDFSNLFQTHGNLMTAFINKRTAYEGKVSGYVIYKNKSDCVKAITELNLKHPHYFKLEPAFPLSEIVHKEDNQRITPLLEHIVKTNLKSSYPEIENDRKTVRNKGSIHLIKDEDWKGREANVSRENGPPIKSSIQSCGSTNHRQLPHFGEGEDERKHSKEMRTAYCSKVQSDKDFLCKVRLHESEKGALGSNEKYKNKTLIDNNENSVENLRISSDFTAKKESNENLYHMKNHVTRSVERKYLQGITETTVTIAEESQNDRISDLENNCNKTINERGKRDIGSQSSHVKLTAKDIKEANFKVDGSRQLSHVNYINESRCSTWGLLSNDPKNEFVNYDLCTQQKKLSTDSFTEVNIYYHIGPGEYWVHCKSDLQNLKLISKSLFSKVAPNFSCKPAVGDYYSVILETTCYRCKVLSADGHKSLVQLIDFGILIDCEIENLRELPELMKNYYAQAIHVKLDPWTPEKYLNLKKGDALRIKATEMIHETTKAQVEGVLYSQITSFPISFMSNKTDVVNERSDCENTLQAQWPPSVLNFLKLGQEVSCSVLGITMDDNEQKDGLNILIECNNTERKTDEILSAFHKLCMKLPEDHSFRPVVGELIAAYHEEYQLWMRALLLSSDSNRWLVACCDFGIVLEVKKVQRLPKDEDYSKIPSLAARCYIISSWLPRDDLFSEEWIKETSTLQMKIIEKEDKHFVCHLRLAKDFPLCVIKVGIWVPEIHKPIFSKYSQKSERLQYVNLSSGEDVRIVSFYTSLSIHVQPWAKENQLQIENLHEQINSFVVKSEPLKVIPVKGKMYICIFTQDMKYYRAIVNKVKSPKEIYVTYIDYGNSETVPISNLYEISSELEKVPCFAVKIGLKKKFMRLLNKNAILFLTYLSEENEDLTLICPDGNLRRCDLMRRNGDLLSDILKGLVDPS